MRKLRGKKNTHLRIISVNKNTASLHQHPFILIYQIDAAYFSFYIISSQTGYMFYWHLGNALASVC